MKRLLLLLPLVLILSGCNISYNDYCEPIAMNKCVGYDYYKYKTIWNGSSSNSICEIRCLNYITGYKIDLDVVLNKNRF